MAVETVICPKCKEKASVPVPSGKEIVDICTGGHRFGPLTSGQDETIDHGDNHFWVWFN